MRMKSASMSVSLAVIAIVAALSATEPATEHVPPQRQKQYNLRKRRH